MGSNLPNKAKHNMYPKIRHNHILPPPAGVATLKMHILYPAEGGWNKRLQKGKENYHSSPVPAQFHPLQAPFCPLPPSSPTGFFALGGGQQSRDVCRKFCQQDGPLSMPVLPLLQVWMKEESTAISSKLHHKSDKMLPLLNLCSMHS